MAVQQSDTHGREAQSPQDIPKPGWRDVMSRVKDQISEDNLSIVSGGVAFYAFLAIFPALAAAVAIYGMIMDPQQVSQQIQAAGQVLPQEAQSLVERQVTRLTESSSGALGFGAAIGVLLAVWSANKGTKALITALNIAYDERETRGFLKLNAVSLALTIFALVMGLIAVALVAVLPAFLGNLGLGSGLQWTLSLLRWPILFVLGLIILGVFYRFGPDRDAPRLSWVTPGAVAGTLLWIVGSIAFSIYVNNFGSYNETYGALAAVVILMLWFSLSAFVALLGAEINAESERQTRRDTTQGQPKPMGSRGAYSADTVAKRGR